MTPELQEGAKYRVRSKQGGFPWLSEGKKGAVHTDKTTVLARFEGWSGGKALFRVETGKWRFSMTKFELAGDYLISRQ
jgi:hypothetical protein